MWVKIASGEGKGMSVRVEGERFLVGTGSECQLMVGDSKVAPLHAYFEVEHDGRVMLRDLGSESGTFVNGERVEHERQIEGGEEIRVGDTLLTPSVGDRAEERRHLAEHGVHQEHEPAVRVRTEEGTVEVVPAHGDGGADDDASVRVETEGEAVEVVPVGEHRRLRERITVATVAAGAAALIAIAALAIFLATSGGGTSTADIVDFAKPRTVLVQAQLGPGRISEGTGIVLDAKRGLIVTNFHVVNGGRQIAIAVGDSPRDAALYAAAPCDDLAILHVTDNSSLKTMPLGSQEEVRQGDRVVAVGFPANAAPGATLSATDGVISVVRTSFDAPSGEAPPYVNAVQTTAPLNPGNSGGPLIDQDEHVVGVNAAALLRAGGAPIQNQGYAIGVDRLKQLLPKLRSGKSQAFGGFGIGPPPNRVKGSGLLALPEAGAGGSVAGQLITAINGTPLKPSFASYCDAVGDVASGQTAVLSVQARDGTSRQVPVKFR